MECETFTGDHEQAAGHGSAAWHRRLARSAHEAARLRAAHRYFQRTTIRAPFRKEDVQEPTVTGWWL